MGRQRDAEGWGPIRIVGISGSLRAASSNGNLVQALGLLVPDGAGRAALEVLERDAIALEDVQIHEP